MATKKNSSNASISIGNGSGTGTLWTSNTATISATPATPLYKDPKDNLAINLDKFMEIPKEKREFLLELIKISNNTDYRTREMINNTMEIYGLLEDKDILKRKIKIEGVINED